MFVSSNDKEKHFVTVHGIFDVIQVKSGIFIYISSVTKML